MVDRIEYCVNQTSDHVGQARGELIKAEEYQRKSRKVKKRSQTLADRAGSTNGGRTGAETGNPSNF